MRVLTTLVTLVLMSLDPVSVKAQQWTPSEREAWAAVSRGWEALRAEDVDGFMATFHPQFLGWNMSRPAPLDVAAERSGTVEFLAAYDWVSFAIEPAGIRVTDDVAVVHYRYHDGRPQHRRWSRTRGARPRHPGAEAPSGSVEDALDPVGAGVVTAPGPPLPCIERPVRGEGRETIHRG
jgi:hypothetical protein